MRRLLLGSILAIAICTIGSSCWGHGACTWSATHESCWNDGYPDLRVGIWDADESTFVADPVFCVHDGSFTVRVRFIHIDEDYAVSETQEENGCFADCVRGTNWGTIGPYTGVGSAAIESTTEYHERYYTYYSAEAGTYTLTISGIYDVGDYLVGENHIFGECGSIDGCDGSREDIPRQQPYPSVQCQFRAILADIDADSNNDGAIDASDEPVEEMSPGKIVYTTSATPTQVALADTGLITGEKAILSAVSGGSAVRIWDSSSKTNEITLPKTYTIGTEPPPSSIYAEGLAIGEVILKLELQAGPSLDLISTDQIRLTVMESPGRTILYNDYLCPGGPARRHLVFSEAGNQVREINKTYGPEGELLSISGSADPVTYTYDAAYRIMSLIDGNNRTTYYGYDDVGNLRCIYYPEGDTVQFPDYDPAGNVLRRIDANGLETTYSYDDPEGLLTDVAYQSPSSGLNAHYAYDSAYGRLTEVQDGTGTRTYTYDDLDVVRTATVAYNGLSGGGRTITYDYWQDGSVSSVVTPAGTFSYEYDEAGRLTDLTNPYSETFNWTYLDNNWLNTQSTPVSVTTYAYNPRGFLTSLLNEKLDETPLTGFTSPASTGYDAVGNRLSLTTGDETTTYTYDAKDQLTRELSERNGGYDYSFAYDAAGNPTTFKGATRTFNLKNQNEDFTFDDNGNPTSYGSLSLAYDPEDRLISWDSGGTTTAAYTSDGLRAWKQTGSVRTYYLGPCEFDSSGNVIATDTFGPSGLISRRTSSGSIFYAFDPQGSVAQTLNSSGTVISSQVYDAYGSLLSGDATPPYGYGAQHGYYTDTETGLLLLTHRYYDPAEGRFLTRDPIGYAGGMNLYAYTGNNPVNLADPLGFCGNASPPWYDKAARLGDALNESPGGRIGRLLNPCTPSLGDLLRFPSKIGHLGEKSGDWAGHKTWGGALGVADDILTAATVVSGAAGAMSWAGGVGNPLGTSGVANGISGYRGSLGRNPFHGLDQAVSRDGHGVSPKAILDAVRNGTQTVQTGGRIKYTGGDAVVVLDRNGQVVTTYATSRAGWRY